MGVLLRWAIFSRLEPVKKIARLIKKHLWSILNRVVLDAYNGHAESTNSKIKMIKFRGRVFRSNERFKTAFYFHLGGWISIRRVSDNADYPHASVKTR
jgi:transposase